jgi:hypothetical protein
MDTPRPDFKTHASRLWKQCIQTLNAIHLDFKCTKNKIYNNLSQIFVGIPIIPILQLFHVYFLNFRQKESKPKDYFVYLHLSTVRLTMMPIEVGGATGLDTT